MSNRTPLTNEQINSALDNLNAIASAPWEIEENKLLRRYDFKSFGDAISFMAQIALDCEKLDHHPRWVNVWNMVEISLFTFKVKGLTELDFELSARMERLANRLLAQ
ncbi:MAG: 4a-hydroxytetrahydrobiopterin dehydratase [Gammaproteobacteria bacterium]|jgi:4a-hydroxytetrahydrobiopterin dehydratase